MRITILTAVILFFIFKVNGQQINNSKILKLQDKIAQMIGELKNETSVNYMKHINQVEGFKQGLWIESTNGEVWFANYDLGLKHGDLTIYSTSGKKYVAAKYDKGFLIDTVVFYNLKGLISETYENITSNDTIVERQIETAEGDKIYFSKEKHRFDYKAYVKKYTDEGILYAEGFGLFDDAWILHLFPIREWKYHE